MPDKGDAMIIIQNLETAERRYSDQKVKLRQIETNTLWNDAVDAIPCQFTYEETNIPIDPEEVPDGLEESVWYLLRANMVELTNTDPDPDYLNEHEAEPNYFG